MALIVFMDYTIDNPLCDVTLVCKDEIKLYYSRYILGMKCKALKPAIEDRETKEVPIANYTSCVVARILQYIDKDNELKITTYTNEIIDDLVKVYEFAHQYDFKHLETMLEKVFEKNVSISVLMSM